MMKRYVFSSGLIGASIVIVAANGCEINPFDPPNKAKPIATGSSSSGAITGAGGTGGTAGTGGAAGMGGVAGIGGGSGMGGEGGAPCSCAANGTPCNANADCQSSICDPVGLCCDQMCTGPCRSCNQQGLEGTCSPFPTGLQVDGCTALDACNDVGECVSLDGKAPLGGTCLADSDCFAPAQCKARGCRTANNGACAEYLECRSNLCDPIMKICKACTVDADCPNGAKCNAGNASCTVYPGEPCDLTLDCAQGFCSANLCALGLGSACLMDAQCASHNCVNGTCAICGGPSSIACEAGTTCIDKVNDNDNYCLLTLGNYCVYDAQCQSNQCTDFPPRCK
jgi:hypothetical protein